MNRSRVAVGSVVSVIYAAFMAAVIVLAIVALRPQPRPRVSILIPPARYPDRIDLEIRGLTAQVALAGKYLARDERELRGIRASLDHVVVHVHGCACGR